MSKLERVKMQELDPKIRATNWEEVAMGFTLDEAIIEAQRCLECKTQPCVSGCPVNVPIPQFISKVKVGDIQGAYEIITSENLLPSICGRVCPQEKQCEAPCVRGIKGEAIAIGALERYVADNAEAKKAPTISSNNIKVAVVGSGPAGVACAADLRLYGFEVTMFEALHELGGVLAYGIPDFRLPKTVLKRELDYVLELGVNVEKNVIVGKSVSLADLKEEGFEAIFIATGAGLPRMLNIPGENLDGVLFANGFLTRVNLMKGYQFPNYHTPIKMGNKVAVVGAGNVAMDAARTAKRLGAKDVYIVYRRSEKEVPARLEEVHHAKQEGVNFKLLTNPVEIIGEDFKVVGLKCEIMELGEPDESGRRRPVGTNEFITLDVDTVITAIGQSPNPTVFESNDGIKRNKWGIIEVDEDTLETNLENVYAGGDIITGAATVILAMGAGRKAALSIKNKLLK